MVEKLRAAPDVYARRNVAAALAMIRPAGVAALLQVFQSTGERIDLRLQVCAAFDKAIKDDGRILLALRQALTDPQPAIRLCAAHRLARGGEATQSVLTALEEAFVKADRQEARDSLEALGAKSIPTVLRLLNRPDIRRRDLLTELLGKIYSLRPHDLRIIPALLRSLRDPAPEVRQSAAEILGQLAPDGAPVAISSLVARIEQGADAVVGSRYVPGGGTVNWPVHRRLLSRWGNRYAPTWPARR